MSDLYVFRSTASDTAADHLEHVHSCGCDHEAVYVEGELYALTECDNCAPHTTTTDHLRAVA